jgi:hypothetical protein
MNFAGINDCVSVFGGIRTDNCVIQNKKLPYNSHLEDCEFCGKFTFTFRKKFYLLTENNRLQFQPISKWKRSTFNYEWRKIIYKRRIKSV